MRHSALALLCGGPDGDELCARVWEGDVRGTPPPQARRASPRLHPVLCGDNAAAESGSRTTYVLCEIVNVICECVGVRSWVP